MISNEYRKPYMRPPLSKELWYSAQEGEVAKDLRFKQWTGAERRYILLQSWVYATTDYKFSFSLFFEPEEFFVSPTELMSSNNGGIAVAQGYTIKKIDPTSRIATLSDGYEIGYDECLIATGKCK